MAYYDDVSKKSGKTNYAEKGSWDEEGSHYRNNGKYNSFRSGQASRKGNDLRESGLEAEKRRNNSVCRKEPHGERYWDRTEKRDGRHSVRNELKETSNSYNRTSIERPLRESRNSKPDRSAAKSAEEINLTGYEGYEFRRSSWTVETDEQEYILCGRNPIREALRNGRGIEKLLVQKGELSGSAREIVKEARERKIMVQEADKRRMDAIAPHHQGLIAFAEAYEYATVDEILASAGAKQEAPFIVLLDGLTDPHNLGAIIRTAECVGAHGVIIPQHRSVGLTPSAVKASAGAVEHMLIARVTNLNRTIEDLKRAGIWVYALSMDGKDYEKVDFHGGTALVIGAEGEGISRLTAEKCDMTVSLPMLGKLDSLNASVAAGVVMYRVLSSRRTGN